MIRAHQETDGSLGKKGTSANIAAGRSADGQDINSWVVFIDEQVINKNRAHECTDNQRGSQGFVKEKRMPVLELWLIARSMTYQPVESMAELVGGGMELITVGRQ